MVVCCALIPGIVYAVGDPLSSADAPDASAHAFYYPWYANPEVDGSYAHWNHSVFVRRGPPRSYPGGGDIGADFYPQLGTYSSNDPDLIHRHMQMLRGARIGVISVSWWGQDSFTNRALPRLFELAHKHGVRINFHIEPFRQRNATSTRDAIRYLLDRYGDSPSLYRDAGRGGRPMFYVYDSYLTSPREWSTILQPDSPDSIRGTRYDSLVIGLWVKEQDGDALQAAGFDGCYTYFATDGFTHGSTTSNWPSLARWARDRDKLFIPCVGPGYLDLRIRPWNERNRRDREDGAYYDRMFAAALRAGADIIGITSFNEWHEGTQIEPAVPRRIPGFIYADYAPRDPSWYLNRTAYWIDKWREQRQH